MTPAITVLMFAGAFASGAALDFASARYIAAVRDDDYHVAGTWSVIMCLLSTYAVCAAVEVTPWVLVPQCVGLYAGTRLAGRRSAR